AISRRDTKSTAAVLARPDVLQRKPAGGRRQLGRRGDILSVAERKNRKAVSTAHGGRVGARGARRERRRALSLGQRVSVRKALRRLRSKDRRTGESRRQ